MSSYQRNGRSHNLRVQAEEARRLAVARRWKEAFEINRRILEQAPRDVEAMNRLGKALNELGQINEALEAYRNTLSTDPGNFIAQRNVARLEQMVASGWAPGPEEQQTDQKRSAFRASIFIEETGKTYVADLVRPASAGVISTISPADEVELRPEAGHVHVFDQRGNRLGQLEPWIAQRLMELLDAGHRYQAFVVALSGNTVRVIVREVYRNPEAPLGNSFPRQAKIAAPRPYIRETTRRELDPDLLDTDEDETELDETEEVEADEDAEDDDEDIEDEGGEEEEDDLNLGG